MFLKFCGHAAKFVQCYCTVEGKIWPLIVLRDPKLRVVQVAIAFLFGDQRILWDQVFAGAFVSTLPILFLFLLLQRQYISGMTTSGIKG